MKKRFKITGHQDEKGVITYSIQHVYNFFQWLLKEPEYKVYFLREDAAVLSKSCFFNPKEALDALVALEKFKNGGHTNDVMAIYDDNKHAFVYTPRYNVHSYRFVCAIVNTKLLFDEPDDAVKVCFKEKDWTQYEVAIEGNYVGVTGSPAIIE